MSREVHVRCCEQLGGRFPGLTRLSIYTKTKSDARKIGNAIFKFLKNKLKLSINREKSGIRRPVNFTILGFGFVPTYVKGERGKYQLVVSDKSWRKLRQKLKIITKKTTPMSFDERIVIGK